MRVFVTGATGLIGRALCADLVRGGHDVVALSRAATPSLPAGTRVVRGNPAQPGPWQEELAACDACVNLAGESLAGRRWNAERKRRIRESRVEAARNTAAVIADRGPEVLLSGSASGYYGSRGEEELDESSAPGADFLAELLVAWEEAAAPASRRARVVLLRSGIVLAREGGALPRMALPFRLFVGGPIGSGAFWQPWIHVADEVGLVAWALGDEKVSGPLNLVGPVPARNRDVARAIGRALGRPSLVPVPALAVRLALGEVVGAVTSSQRMIPRKALDLGYRFRFEEVGAATRDLLG